MGKLITLTQIKRYLSGIFVILLVSACAKNGLETQVPEDSGGSQEQINAAKKDKSADSGSSSDLDQNPDVNSAPKNESAVSESGAESKDSNSQVAKPNSDPRSTEPTERPNLLNTESLQKADFARRSAKEGNSSQHMVSKQVILRIAQMLQYKARPTFLARFSESERALFSKSVKISKSLTFPIKEQDWFNALQASDGMSLAEFESFKTAYQKSFDILYPSSEWLLNVSKMMESLESVLRQSVSDHKSLCGKFLLLKDMLDPSKLVSPGLQQPANEMHHFLSQSEESFCKAPARSDHLVFKTLNLRAFEKFYFVRFHWEFYIAGTPSEHILSVLPTFNDWKQANPYYKDDAQRSCGWTCAARNFVGISSYSVKCRLDPKFDSLERISQVDPKWWGSVASINDRGVIEQKVEFIDKEDSQTQKLFEGIGSGLKIEVSFDGLQKMIDIKSNISAGAIDSGQSYFIARDPIVGFIIPTDSKPDLDYSVIYYDQMLKRNVHLSCQLGW